MGHDHATHAQHQPAEATQYDYTGMPPADYVLIEVEDTGTACAGASSRRSSSRSFRPRNCGKGTGLGLSTGLRHHQADGRLHLSGVRSRQGHGVPHLPAAPRSGEGEAVAKAVATPVRDLTGHERILLVEDEDNVRAFSGAGAAGDGYEVFEADSGEQALEVLDDIGGQIDLMVSDVVMPEMDGPALLLKVRERLPTLKVIFVSGYAEESVRQDIADDQTVEFLAKPYSLDQINSKVKEVLGKGGETLN
jgi:two-component system cell cycle sensor histidine kinase/response regulator CckA